MTGRDGAGRRFEGVDLARALAMTGMLMVHVGPTHVPGLAGRLYALSHGRASILFMVVAGIGVALLAAARSGWLNGARTRLAWRAAVLLPLGLWLQTLEITALVILPVYAALVVLAIGLLWLPGRALLWLALAVAAAGPVAAVALRMYSPLVVGSYPLTLGDPAGDIALGLLVEGPYPLITWAAPFIFGLWLGRLDLGRPAVRWWCLGGGAAVAAACLGAGVGLQAWLGEPDYLPGWDALLRFEPHSQMPLWLWGATGSAVAATGACLLLADGLGRLVWPLVALGQLALTFYVGHLLVLAAWPSLRMADTPGDAAVVVLSFLVPALVLATVWRWLLPRGPLEAVLHLPWALPRLLRFAGTRSQ